MATILVHSSQASVKPSTGRLKAMDVECDSSPLHISSKSDALPLKYALQNRVVSPLPLPSYPALNPRRNAINIPLNPARPPDRDSKKPTPVHESSDESTSTTTYTSSTLFMLPPPKALHLGLFEIGKPLGKGKFGRVYLVRHRPSGFVCALKTLYKDQIAREGAENLVRREIDIHRNLSHPGILKFYNYFHDSKRIFLILEYAAGGELYRVLQKQKQFEEPRAANYIAQVASSLQYLHSKHVMHRDLKPENILVGIHGELKLADFGYSVHSSGNRRDTLCGTLDYLPPEMLVSSKSVYTSAIDIWTLGVLSYEFLMGEAPFEDTQVMTRRRIAKNEMTPLSSSLSRGAKDFVHALLQLDPSKRLSLTEVLQHPWIVHHCNK